MSIIKIDPSRIAPTVADYQTAIQAMVDETAQSLDFRSGDSLASYVTSTVSLWAAQAQAFVAWRDNVWQHAYGELAKVQAGEREQPSVEVLIGELPPITWPE
ncbi:hypothetical protein [Neorhizobium sp. T25_27]|uniref:hypothetical protein n=1 Tax=Neorhizobium sp. T25_27 TaxID=2093831 RepID=UPI000CF8B4D9|nr:hypothetical protein [Neorhizobium sp. T25_27]